MKSITDKVKVLVYHLLNSNPFTRALINSQFKKKYDSSAGYWEKWYQNDGTSGSGSYGDLAVYKATILNRFVTENNITSVIELGCGDGNQLQQFHFPSYTGVDVAPTAVNKCTELFKTDKSKRFILYDHAAKLFTNGSLKADLALSLDVIYHLLEDDVYEKYLQDLFSAAERFVIIYAWDEQKPKSLHIRHRKFTPWIQTHFKDWHFKQKIAYKGKLEACDFFVYKKDIASV